VKKTWIRLHSFYQCSGKNCTL